MSSKLFGTKVATSPTLGAGIFQMIFHKYTRNHRSTFIATWNRIMFTCIQVCLNKSEIWYTSLCQVFFFLISNSVFWIILPSASLIRPTTCSHPCDVCSIRLNPLLPFRPPCLGRSEKRPERWKILFAFVSLSFVKILKLS